MNARLSTAAFALSALLAGCATTSPDVIDPRDANRLANVQDATVLSVRPVTVDGSQSGLGAVTGGAIGGVAGSSVGGSREQLVVGIVGAVAGAVVGNTVERAATRENAVELLLQLKNGERRAVVQAAGSEKLQPGDPVIMVLTGGKVRVMRAPPPAAP